jgi:hypothetical protein
MDFVGGFNNRPMPMESNPPKMSVAMAMGILFDPDGFFPETYKEEARKAIETQGTEEQKSFLPRETQYRESQKKRLATIGNV